MKKVLITGIEGFTGKHLERFLRKEGFEVYGTSLKTQKDMIFQCDIADKARLLQVLRSVQPNYIIHLAGISFAAYGDIEAFYKVNVVGTATLFEALELFDTLPKKIIIASSATVYGEQKDAVLFEEMCPNPLNHYGISKLAAEQVAKGFFDKMDVIITRPFNYTGIGQPEHFLIPKIVSHFKQGKKVIELGNLHVEREFNDIIFACEIYKRLMLLDVKSEVVNIASGRGVKLLDVIAMMEEIAGYKIDVKVNPKFVRKNDVPSLTGSATKLFELIGEVEQKELCQTLREMYEA